MEICYAMNPNLSFFFPQKKLVVKHFTSTPLEKLHIGDKLCFTKLCKEATAGLPMQGDCAQHSFHTIFQVGKGSSEVCWAWSREHAPPAPASSCLRGLRPSSADCKGSVGSCRHQGTQVGLIGAACRVGSFREGPSTQGP